MTGVKLMVSADGVDRAIKWGSHLEVYKQMDQEFIATNKKNSITNKFHQNFTTFTTITGANRRRSFALTITQVLIAVAFCHFIIVIFCQCVSTAAVWKLARAAAPHYLQKSCNAIPHVYSTIIYKHNWLQFLFVVKGTASKQ